MFVRQYDSTWELYLLDLAINSHLDSPQAKNTSLESSRRCESGDAAQEITFCRIKEVNTLFEKNVSKIGRKKTIFYFQFRSKWLLYPVNYGSALGIK